MMYIVLIAWCYVTLLMAAAETSVTAGVLTFIFYGLLPASLFWWLLGGQRQLREMRRQRAAYRALKKTPEPDQESLTNPMSNQSD